MKGIEIVFVGMFFWFKKNSNNCFNLIIPFVTLFAVAALGKKCANPFGPELQVKQMFDGRCARKD